jgi:hypothetical protein
LETCRRNAVRRWVLTLRFNLLVLVGTVKMADRVVRELMGL